MVAAGLPESFNFCSSLFIRVHFLLPQSSVTPTDGDLSIAAAIPSTRRHLLTKNESA